MDSTEAAKMTFAVVGGLGIFLLGMKNMSEGMQAIAGDRLRKLINAITNNRIIACGVGVLVTAIIQSSSVTTVMVVGMVNAGLMSLVQAIGVVLGADIGTTITAWILQMKIANYGLPILGISAFFYLFSRNDRLRYSALMLLGLGMVFFGLSEMKEGFLPLRDMPEFQRWFSMFTPNTYLGVLKCCLVGAIVTAIVQSSSATVGITLGLASTGVINFETAAALVLGENIGTTVTAYLAAIGASTNAKRTALAHFMIKVFGVAWITAIFFYYVKFIVFLLGVNPSEAVIVNGKETFPHAARAIALSHTCFNVLNVIVLMPFVPNISKILHRIMPDKVYIEKPHLKYIDVRMLDAPAIGIEQSKKEIVLMGDNVRKMMNRLKLILTRDVQDEVSESKIFQSEEVLDIVQKEIMEFLSLLLSGNVSHGVMNAGRVQLRMADEYESISDYIANILKLNIKMRSSQLVMSAEAKAEVLELHDRVSNYIALVNDAVHESNIGILSKATICGDAITHFIKDCRNRHLQRVGTEGTSPLKSLIFTDMLNSYRRIKDHCLNIAEALAGEK